MFRRIKLLLLAPVMTVLLGAGIVAVAAPAQAANDGWVYLVVQDRNCSNGGQVKQITGAVNTTYTYQPMWSGGDAGDNIIYPKVRFGESNTFVGRALCLRGTASVWINVYREFTPRAGQTVWL